jgi:iron complex outermembrane recepter protein
MHSVYNSASVFALIGALFTAASANADSAAASESAATEAATPAATSVSTIIVTARRRQERLADVPLAISAVQGEQLAIQHLDRVADYTLKIPNFSALQQNTRVSGLFIRGLGGNASNDGAEGGVGLIVDNVFFTHVGFSWLDFVDLDGIEVVRGPQGTLLGKNTTIGAVIVKTQQPSFHPSLSITTTYGGVNGADDLFQVRANLTGPIIADKLAGRLTFATSQGGGWITNAVDGVKYLNNNRTSFRGQLLFTPTSKLSSRLIAEHYDTREYNNFYPPAGDATTNLNPDGSVFTANPVRKGWQWKLQNLFGYTPSYNYPYNANLDTQQRLVSRVTGVSNEINADLGGVQLTAVSAWRELYFRPFNDSDYSPFPIARAGYDVDVDQYSQEVRFASKSGGPVDWTVGGYYLHETLRSNLRTILYSDATLYLTGSPLLPSATLNNLEYDRDGHLRVDSIAGFGQASWHVTHRLSLTGGLRYTSETKSVNVAGYSLGGADLSAYPPVVAATRTAILNSFGGTTGAAAGAYNLAAQSDRGSLAWLVNPAYKLTDNVLLYASASYGEKSGAANTSALASQASVVLTQPETSLDFEAGVKTTLARGLATVDINFYNDTIKGYQDSQVDPLAAALGSYLANVGKVRMRGFEFESALHPITGLEIDANVAYNDAKYLSYPNSPAPIEYAASLAAAGKPAILSLTGYQIRNAPKWTVQGGFTFDRPLTGAIHFTAYGNVTWKSRIAFINPLSVFGWQAPYAVLNAGFGLRDERDRWSVSIWSKNLTNTDYATAFAPSASLSPVIRILGDPRSYGVTVSKRF